MKMTVLNHRAEHILILRYASENALMSQKVVLRPGVNSVPSEKWSKVKDHPLVKHRIEDEKLVVVSDESDDPSSLLQSKPETAAVKLVKETTELELLRSWLEAEEEGKTRSKVKKAIQKQIAELEAPLVPDSKADES